MQEHQDISSVKGPVPKISGVWAGGFAGSIAAGTKQPRPPVTPSGSPRVGQEEARKGRFLESPAQASSSAWPFLQAIVALGGPSQSALQGGISGRH